MAEFNLMHKGHFTLRFKQVYSKQHYVEIDIQAMAPPIVSECNTMFCILK